LEIEESFPTKLEKGYIILLQYRDLINVFWKFKILNNIEILSSLPYKYKISP